MLHLEIYVLLCSAEGPATAVLHDVLTGLKGNGSNFSIDEMVVFLLEADFLAREGGILNLNYTSVVILLFLFFFLLVE